MGLKFGITVISLSLLLFPLSAQDMAVPFDILTDIGSQAITFLKDSDDFIWIGTLADGVYRYDGRQLKHYSVTSGLVAGSNVPAVEEDSNGNLWFAASGAGISKYDKEHNTVTFYLRPGGGVSGKTIFWGGKNTLVEDTGGIMWVGTMGEGVYGIDTSTGDITHFGYAAEDEGSLLSDYIRALYIDSLDRLWIGTEEGLSVYDRGGFIHYRPGGDSGRTLSGPIIMSILEDSSGNMWVGTESSGLNRIDVQTGDIEVFSHDPDDGESIGSNRVTYMYEDTLKRIWCSHENFLSIFYPETGKFMILDQDITECFEEGNTQWALFDDGKLGVYEADRPRFRTYTVESDRENGLVSDIVVSIFEDSRKDLWITSLGGLHRFDRETGRFTVFLHEPGNPETLPSTVDYSPGIFEDSDGIFWIGNASPGSLSILDRDTGKVLTSFLHDPEDPYSMPDCGQVNVIIEDSDDRNIFWIASSGGFIEFHKDTGRFLQHTANDCWDIYQDENGIVWAATWGKGLLRYDPGTGNLSYIEHDPGNPASPSANIMTAIIETSDGRIWIGAENGLNLLDEVDGTCVSYTEENGFPMKAIHSVGEDASGILWLGTADGLVRFDPVNLEMRVYRKEDGFKSNMFYAGNGILGSDGRMWFGGTMGMVSFYPDEMKMNPFMPPVRLTSIKQGGIELNLPSAPERLEELVLDWRNNFFEFELAAPSYRLPDKNQFAYMLEGVDQDWFYSGTMNFGRYAGLEPGNYVLRMKAANNDGLWNESDRSVRVAVTPPFWKAWWFFMLVIIFCLGMVLLVISYVLRLRREIIARKRTEDKLSGAYEDLKRLDVLKDEFLANTSHELRTPLHGIIGLAESLLDGAGGQIDDRLARNVSLIMASARRLTNLVNDILDFSKLRHRDIRLKITTVDMHSLSDMIADISGMLIGKKPLTIRNEISGDARFVLADPDRVQQVLYNLLSNAIKFTAEGTIRIYSRREGSLVVISVEDTGIGIPPEKQECIFESFEQADGSIEREYGGTGLGLAVSRQLVELHGGHLGVRSVPGEGSCFFFSLPAAEEVDTGTEYRPAIAGPPVFAVGDGLQELGTIQADEGNGDEIPRILIVDDEPVNLQLLSNQLSLRNFEVTQAYNGEEALKEIDRRFEEDRPFEMVLLDVMMPRMSGYEVCRRVREKYPGDRLPIIMLTARNRVEDLIVGLKSGANDYITKPFSREELLARIENQKELYDLVKANRKAMMLVEKSLDEKEILIKEIHHRVKNNLAVIIALLNLQSVRYSEDIRAKFVEIINRIHAIGLVHEKLYESPDMAEIDIRDYLLDLILDISSTLNAGEITVEDNIQPLKFSLQTMIPLALIVTELLTNSIKYGTHNGSDLNVYITLQQSDSKISFVYRDNGPGYPEGFDIMSTDTLGMKIILSLSDQLEGSFRILDSPGAGVELVFSP
ncbi:MAG: response regulator [Spirochaetales bacterium]|nr:response regulator [Spirochaetales bacterium]